nr:MAG TPA: hypothetical protein [Bacteriophage sp.]
MTISNFASNSRTITISKWCIFLYHRLISSSNFNSSSKVSYSFS